MASNMFLELDGIKGESTDKDYKDHIEVLTFGWGVAQKASGTASSSGGGTVARANFHELSVTKEVDSSSPQLYRAAWSGTHIPKAVLKLNKDVGGKRVKYMEYKMENIVISSINTKGGQNSLPTESITLNYGKISITYLMQSRKGGTAAGAIPAGYDLEKNTNI